MKIYSEDTSLVHYLKHCYTTLGIYSDDSKLDLAIALLADVIGIEESFIFYNTFKVKVVDQWEEGWKISEQEIINFVKQRRKESYGQQSSIFQPF